MFRRPRSFDCEIAARPVRISLRAGGGLHEPSGTYVRCEERDCQYVDVNQPPCPLGTAMFDDGSEQRLAHHVRTHAGSRVCYACVTALLEMTHEQARRAVWRLKDEPGVSIRPGRCGVCHRRGVTIGVAREVRLRAAAEPNVSSETTPEASSQPTVEALASHLRRQRGFSFCVHCLARELGTGPSVVREAVSALEPEPAFSLRTSQCVMCLVAKPGIRFEEPISAEAGIARALEFIVEGRGNAFCASCLALSTDCSLADTRRVMQQLHELPELEHLELACSGCGRWQPVVRTRSSQMGSPSRNHH